MDKRRTLVPLVCHGHSRPIVDLSYSPITDDGYFIISASKDGKPMLRNGETGDWIGTFEGHKGCVWAACLDRPALRAATASADFTARIWDAISGDEKHVFEHKHIVRSIAFSHSTTRLLTGGAEKIVRIFDLHQPEAPPTQIPGLPGSVRCASWHDDDRLILAACADSTGVLVLDARTLQTVKTLPTSSPVTSVEVSASASSPVITTADGKNVNFWDGESLTLLKTFTLPQHVESASLFSPKGLFAAGGEDMWVRLYDYETAEEKDCNKGHHGPVHCVRFAPTGESYSSGSEDGTIRIWKVQPNEQQEEIAVGGEVGKDGVAGTANGVLPGPPGVVSVSAESVMKKVEGFHIGS